jgi:alkylation response protein AidB-like acyl-CoA dehydrogenase
MWITNGTFADVAVVWAQTDDGIRGFAVPTESPGFSAYEIPRKLSLRASVTAELALDDVRLPGSAVFPEVRGLKGPLACLSEARYGILWGVVGAARACFEEALEYTMAREQFGKPLAAFQLTQRKLADMSIAVTSASHSAGFAIGPLTRRPSASVSSSPSVRISYPFGIVMLTSLARPKLQTGKTMTDGLTRSCGSAPSASSVASDVLRPAAKAFAHPFVPSRARAARSVSSRTSRIVGSTTVDPVRSIRPSRTPRIFAAQANSPFCAAAAASGTSP